MVDVRISLNADVKRVTRSLQGLAQKQIPFAISQALNAIGTKVQAAEKVEIKKEFPTAMPFTVSSVALKKARKGETEVVIFVRDIAAEYLLPFTEGGKHHLNSRALLNPKNIALNSYGNIPRNLIERLKGRADVFIGPVKSKNGATINGVWQRVAEQTARPAVAAKGKRKARAARVAVKAHLKLLVRFGDALPVRQNLDWEGVGKKTVAASFDKEFGSALGKAIATAGLK